MSNHLAHCKRPAVYAANTCFVCITLMTWGVSQEIEQNKIISREQRLEARTDGHTAISSGWWMPRVNDSLWNDKWVVTYRVRDILFRNGDEAFTLSWQERARIGYDRLYYIIDTNANLASIRPVRHTPSLDYSAISHMSVALVTTAVAA